MGRVVVLGESVRVQGYALAGVLAVIAESPDEVRHAWATLANDVELVVVTPDAALALNGKIGAGVREPLVVEMTA